MIAALSVFPFRMPVLSKPSCRDCCVCYIKGWCRSWRHMATSTSVNITHWCISDFWCLQIQLWSFNGIDNNWIYYTLLKTMEMHIDPIEWSISLDNRHSLYCVIENKITQGWLLYTKIVNLLRAEFRFILKSKGKILTLPAHPRPDCEHAVMDARTQSLRHGQDTQWHLWLSRTAGRLQPCEARNSHAPEGFQGPLHQRDVWHYAHVAVILVPNCSHGFSSEQVNMSVLPTNNASPHPRTHTIVEDDAGTFPQHAQALTYSMSHVLRGGKKPFRGRIIVVNYWVFRRDFTQPTG